MKTIYSIYQLTVALIGSWHQLCEPKAHGAGRIKLAVEASLRPQGFSALHRGGASSLS